MTAEQIRHARQLLSEPDDTVASIAKLLGVSRNTIFKYVPELKGGRAASPRPSPRPRCPALPHPRTDQSVPHWWSVRH
ncbi:helix-turn-helix domain-containing protein [Streptomyces sioyaensis]|uniref:helix-turn-helix domain-containing protein n=1 Tax=Streptomyces sioyaensis TaxID=67364 RepID=UPI0033F28146